MNSHQNQVNNGNNGNGGYAKGAEGCLVGFFCHLPMSKNKIFSSHNTQLTKEVMFFSYIGACSKWIPNACASAIEGCKEGKRTGFEAHDGSAWSFLESTDLTKSFDPYVVDTNIVYTDNSLFRSIQVAPETLVSEEKPISEEKPNRQEMW